MQNALIKKLEADLIQNLHVQTLFCLQNYVKITAFWFCFLFEALISENIVMKIKNKCQSLCALPRFLHNYAERMYLTHVSFEVSHLCFYQEDSTDSSKFNKVNEVPEIFSLHFTLSKYSMKGVGFVFRLLHWNAILNVKKMISRWRKRQLDQWNNKQK